MSDQTIIAHADLLRSVDRLLSVADVLRQKRETLDRLLMEQPQVERRRNHNREDPVNAK